MGSMQQSDKGEETREYEKFGLYPYKTLQDIVARLDAGEYKDSNGQALVNSAAFQELEKMAYEPSVPDPGTAVVAAIIHYWRRRGIKMKAVKTFAIAYSFGT